MREKRIVGNGRKPRLEGTCNGQLATIGDKKHKSTTREDQTLGEGRRLHILFIGGRQKCKPAARRRTGGNGRKPRQVPAFNRRRRKLLVQ